MEGDDKNEKETSEHVATNKKPPVVVNYCPSNIILPFVIFYYLTRMWITDRILRI